MVLLLCGVRAVARARGASTRYFAHLSKKGLQGRTRRRNAAAPGHEGSLEAVHRSSARLARNRGAPACIT